MVRKPNLPKIRTLTSNARPKSVDLGAPLEQLRLPSRIKPSRLADRAESDDSITRVASSRLAPRHLRIRKVSGRNESIYSIEMANPRRIFGTIRVGKDEDEYLAERMREIDDLPRKAGVLSELQDFSAELSRNIIPNCLESELARMARRNVNQALWIQTDESLIPWEILSFSEGRTRAFLCDTFDLSRWLPHAGKELPVRRIAVVAPTTCGLGSVAEELNFMMGLVKDGLEVHKIEAEKPAVRKALASGHYDCLHFAGHSRSDEATLLLDEGVLAPRNLLGNSIHLGDGPLVFLNACNTGRPARPFNGFSGWAESFLGAGARAFLGSHWATEDAHTCIFAKAFYRSFLMGAPIAQAVREARCAIRVESDTTWAAYILCAHPLARCPRAKVDVGS